MEYPKHTWTSYSAHTYASSMRMRKATYYVVTVVGDSSGGRPPMGISLSEDIAPYDGASLTAIQNALPVTWQTSILDTQNIWLPGTGMAFSAS